MIISAICSIYISIYLLSKVLLIILFDYRESKSNENMFLRMEASQIVEDGTDPWIVLKT